MLQPEGGFGELLLRTIAAGPYEALAEKTARDDAVIRLAKAATRVVWSLFHSAELPDDAARAFENLLALEEEIVHEVAVYGPHANVDESRLKALADTRQLLLAFLEMLDDHQEELRRGEFTGGELR
jgi:cyanate lyase